MSGGSVLDHIMWLAGRNRTLSFRTNEQFVIVTLRDKEGAEIERRFQWRNLRKMSSAEADSVLKSALDGAYSDWKRERAQR